MGLEFFIAKRYVIYSGGAFRKIISGISIGGVAIGVSSLIIVVSVENGFHKTFKEKILATNPDVIVNKFHFQPIRNYQKLVDQIKKIKHVKKVTPYIYGKAIIKSHHSQDGIILRGVEKEEEVEGLVGNLEGIVLGKYLAERLGVFLYDTVSLYILTGTSLSTLRKKDFFISGVFDAGLYEHTKTLAYLKLKEMQKFLNLKDEVTSIGIRLDDIYKAKEVAEIINEEIGYPYHAYHWIELNSNLFKAMRLEKITLSIILCLIIIVACFGISATLIMLITQKTREIGILRALGVRAERVMKIFMIKGMLIGSVGSGIGVIIGWISCWLLKKYKFISLPVGVYGTDTLPVYMRGIDFILIPLGALFIAFIASIYPSIKAAKLCPSEAIRYE